MVACTWQALTTPSGLVWRRLQQNRARLRASTSTSIIFSAFAMEAMSELQVNVPTRCPEWLFTMFAVCTTVLVSVHTMALVISTFLLPAVNAACHARNTGLWLDSTTEAVPRLVWLAWSLSTVLGLFLFLLEVVLLCWVKFWDVTHAACWAGTAAMLPFIMAFVAFCVHFHREMLEQGYEARDHQLRSIETCARRLRGEAV